MARRQTDARGRDDAIKISTVLAGCISQMMRSHSNSHRSSISARDNEANQQAKKESGNTRVRTGVFRVKV